jgi:hypothetical protein
MRKTHHITLGLLAGMALAFTSGCNRQAQRRDCVDMYGRITNDQNCQLAEEQRRTGYGGSVSNYHYWYGGSSGGHVGDVVVNGSSSPGSGSSGGFFGGIMRGGFGITGSAGHGGSGGE